MATIITSYTPRTRIIGVKKKTFANSSLYNLVILVLKVLMLRKSQGLSNLQIRVQNFIVRLKKED